MSERSSTSVRVELGPRSYDILVGTDLLAQVGRIIGDLGRTSHVWVVTDEHVAPLYLSEVCNSLKEHGLRTDTWIVPAGEPSKSVETAAAGWQSLLDARADRGTVVAALGGGVVGDLGGFLAATYARGLRFFQIPTSLLAQVDSSVGGKAGINLPQAKNMVGAFHQPMGVVADVGSLRTLPRREYVSGLGEVVKYGMILDAPFFSLLEAETEALLRQDADVLGPVVARCCRLKADIVEKDEREESGLRAVLNYGHTFAHAFETLTGYGVWLHGEAVAAGMHCAAVLAARLGLLEPEVVARQAELLRRLELPTRPPELSPQDVTACMMHDKKVRDGRLRFVLPTEIGHVELIDSVSPEQVVAALQAAADDESVF
ncbi:3-dehydroquinate synthase [Thermopirellula anaerolimosa]